MSLSERIAADTKQAMKAKENATLSTLRLLRSAMKNKQIDVQHELSDEEVLGVIKAQVKQLNDSLESFVAAGREDLAQSTRAELSALSAYLPAQMSDETLDEVVKRAIEQVGATGKQDMGKVMGAAVKAAAGAADGARIKTAVERLLGVFVLAVVAALAPQEAYAVINIVPEPLAYYSFLENGLRIVRVLLLWFGVLSISMLMRGGFIFMVASLRDQSHKEAWGNIAGGLVGATAVVLLYGMMTIVIDVI